MRAYPKRKRAEVSYREISSDESEVNEYDASADESRPHKKFKASGSTISSKTLPKRKIFPFTLLPAELKNQIYEFALTDQDGIFLVSKTRHYRRTVERSAPFPSDASGFHPKRRYRHSHSYLQPQPSTSTPTTAKLTALVPNLLVLNRQIYSEAQPRAGNADSEICAVIYSSNSFIFEDTTALHAFLANISVKNCGTLTNLAVAGWGFSRAHKALNHPAFTLLGSAVNLKRLHIDCRISWGGPQRVATQFYRDGFHWLEAVGIAKGKYDAGVEIIEILDENFDTYLRKKDQTPEDRMEVFRSELRRLLRW